jgi:hypothetical protein
MWRRGVATYNAERSVIVQPIEARGLMGARGGAAGTRSAARTKDIVGGRRMETKCSDCVSKRFKILIFFL